MGLKLILDEELFLEGKNLQKTFDQYKNKLEDADTGEPFEDTDEAYQYFISIIKEDPTYQEGGTTTGDYGTWLLNQEVKGNLNKFRVNRHFEFSVTDLLNDFIEKKSNLEKKDINQYKTPEELYNVLQQTELSSRQKERRIRKDIQGAKKIGSTNNFDIYVPETYEAACALGKGSGWCTADSRTDRYYNYYLDEYGGKYYIAVSKDGKYKYQLHFESDQFSAAGTNPDINTPNDEEMLSISELGDQWPELREFFSTQVEELSPEIILSNVLDELEIDEIFFRIPYVDVMNVLRSQQQKFKTWFSKDGTDIPSIRVFQSLTANQDAYYEFNNIVSTRDKDNIITIDDLQDMVYKCFLWKFSKRLATLKYQLDSNPESRMIYLKFSSAYPDYIVFQCSKSRLIRKLLESFPSNIHEFLLKKDIEGLKEFIDNLLPANDEEFHSTIIELFQTEIIQDVGKLPSVPKAYFNSETTTLFFFEEFEILLMDAVDQAKGI